MSTVRLNPEWNLIEKRLQLALEQKMVEGLRSENEKSKETIKKINSQIDKLLTSKASIVDNETDNSKSNSNDQII